MQILKSMFFCVLVAAAWGCSGDSGSAAPGGSNGGSGGSGGDAGQGGAAGAGGDAGSGGAAGAGGDAGSGGTAGTGGAGGEAGGTAGTGGAAGEAGSGGSAGSGGTAGAGGAAGAGGEAGVGGVAGTGGMAGEGGNAGAGGMSMFENCGDLVRDIDAGEECDDNTAGCVDCLVQATDVSAGGTFDGEFGPDSFDRFRLELSTASNVVFETTGAEGCPGDTIITVTDETEEMLVLDSFDDPRLDDGPDSPCSLLEAKLDAGIYHIFVAHYDAEALAYQVVVSIDPLATEGELCRLADADAGDNCVSGATCQTLENSETRCVVVGCGNGFLEDGEGCDDGNLDDADGCSALCVDELLCGNDATELDVGEECDVDAPDCLGCRLQSIDISSGGTFTGAVGGLNGDYDLFEFTLTEETSVKLDTNEIGGLCETLDTVMYLGRVTENDIEFVSLNDDRNLEQRCSTIVETLPAGQYQVYVEEYELGPIDAYELSIEFLGGCGDLVVDSVLGEQCDEGPDGGNGCDANCQFDAVCGNGMLQRGEECDDDSADCIDCQVAPTVMDMTGAFEGSLAADSFDLFEFTLDAETGVAITTSGATASLSCPDGLDTRLELFVQEGESWVSLADELYDPWEAADDYDGSAPGSGCSQLSLTLPAGAYRVRVWEYDDGPIPTYALHFAKAGVCGDGELNVGEECDGGPACSETCTFVELCGVQGVNVEVGESCDDGGRLNGDGCSLDCQDEETTVTYALSNYTGSISGADENDVMGMHQYRISADGQSFLGAFTSSPDDCDSGDTTLALYALDAQGERIEPAIQENDDIDGTLCSAIDAIVEAGEYVLVVSGFDAMAFYELDIILTRDASVSDDYEGSMVAGLGSDGFDLDLLQESDLSAYVTVNGNCVDTALMVLYSSDLAAPLADSTDYQLLESGCQGLSLPALSPDLYLLELFSDDLQGSDYVLHVDVASNVVVPENSVDACTLKWPDSLGPVSPGYPTEMVYAQVQEFGITDVSESTDGDALVIAEFGFGPSAEDPVTGANWQWSEGEANVEYGPSSPGYTANYDEYAGSFIAPASGSYAFAARFSVDGGQTWTLCDFDGSENGFDVAGAGNLYVARQPIAGELLVTEIMYNPAAVTDSVGEWFEITNVSSEVLTLVGLTVKDLGTDSYSPDNGGPWASGALIYPGEFVVFGTEGDATANGGVEVNYPYSGFSLGNGTDELVLETVDGEIDRVLWSDADITNATGSVYTHSDTPGVALSLSGDGSGKWCDATTAYGAGGDLGTPGSENDVCP